MSRLHLPHPEHEFWALVADIGWAAVVLVGGTLAVAMMLGVDLC